MIPRLRLAALATIPTRVGLLPRVLSSLRVQVDVLCVYLNGWKAVPPCVSELADRIVLDPENSGAERKLHWAQSHEGLYLSCDDDFIYPDDYVARMAEAVDRWRGCALVTAHGRSYHRASRTVLDTVPGSLGIVHDAIRSGRWVNHGGSGVMAWDTRFVRVPAEWPVRNMVDMQVALWAQREQVPIWLIPHAAHWVRGLAILDPKGLLRRSQAERHRRRNAALRQNNDWKILEV